MRSELFIDYIFKAFIEKFQKRARKLEKEVCIRGKNNKIIFHCSHELVGFTLIVRMANKYRKKKFD